MEGAKSLDTKQFIVFKLGLEEYGMDIQKILTIIEKNIVITRIPKTCDYIKGVINLRGEIIPIIDLRVMFKLSMVEDNEDTRIIIAKIDDIAVGFIVDTVTEVVHLDEASIENISNLNRGLPMNYIYGAGKVEGRIIIILSVEKLISCQ